MDGDRQNDPADIPRLLAKLDEGFDVVSGWRRKRQDTLITRKVPSWIANGWSRGSRASTLHDFGCTMKAYRRRVLEGVRLYGEMHRFIPIFASWQGAKVAELEVNHRARTAGKTKYGLGRTFNVVLDLILIRFFQQYAQRPIHLFGRIGLISILLSFASFAGMLYFKYLHHPLTGLGPKTFIETPLPLLAVMFFLGGVQTILMGVLAEMVMRTYYESQSKTTYLLGRGPPGRPRGAGRAQPSAALADWPRRSIGARSTGLQRISSGPRPRTSASWAGRRARADRDQRPRVAGAGPRGGPTRPRRRAG